MNKKVLTLCAGFLLAGGMLSSVSAENISELTEGKYYKIVRTWERATDSGTHAGWSVMEAGYYLGATSMDTEATLWKAVKNADGTISLVNMEGERFTLESEGSSVSNFTIDYNPSALGKAETDPDFNQFKFGTNGILAQAASKDENGVWKLVAGVDNSSDFTEVKPQAFDAEATNLQEVDGLNALDFFPKTESATTCKADGQTYRMYYTHPTTGKMLVTNILKANYDKKLKTWSFTYNESGEEKKFGNEVDFELVKAGDDLIMALPSGAGYVKCNGLDNFEIVKSIEDATIFAFEATKERVPVTVGVLNYYEKDGFSVEITCDKDEDGDWDFDTLAGNEFVGHLTPMTFDWTVIGGNSKEGKFVAADEYAQEFYLKNADGKYIVAVPYDVETALSKESLYNFITVTEDELIHNLKRAWNNQLNDEQELFGRFRLSVDEAQLAQDASKIDEITWLEVNVAHYAPVATYEYATVGRADIKDVPTLVASTSTSLKKILITLGSGQVVDWREFLQPKFFTVEKYNAAGTTSEGKLTASDVFATEFKKTPAGNELENQFALTIKTYKDGNIDRDYYVFSNRETPTSEWNAIPVSALYYTDKDFTYKWGNNIYVIKPVAEVNEADGYKRFSDSELNRQYYISYSSAVFGNVAYLTENHDDAKDAQYHTIGLNPEIEDALVFNIKKYNAARNLKDEQKDHTYNYHPTDSIYVVSNLGFYNTKTKKYDTTQDTLKVLAYTFVNQFNEPLQGLQPTDATTTEGDAFVSDVYNGDGKKYTSVAEAHENAKKFVVRMDNGKYNLRPLYTWKEEFNETVYNKKDGKTSADLYQEFTLWQEDENSNVWRIDNYGKMYAGDALNGILSNTELYDRTENDLFVIEETESEVYRRLVNNVDTISIYRNNNEKSLLYEKTMKINDTTSVNFLGLENIADFTEMAPAMIADTAYVRNDTYKPQYMLVVDPTIHPAGKWCDVDSSSTCAHAVPVPAWTEGRFLVNLVDSAKAWDEAHKHQVGNPYKNTENYYKLGFIQATHRNDSLIVDGNRQFIGNNDNHIAKFQFRYVDTEDKSFVIETSLDGTQTPGYLKWMNGVVAVVDDIKNADVYNMNEDESRQPTANEEISANAAVSVVATDGAVIVKGAEGKNVIVSTILGKVVANEVLNSDNETIAAPAGIVVVSVDGESFKVAVK